MPVKPATRQEHVTAAVKELLVGTIGSMTDKLIDLRNKRFELEKQAEVLKAEADLLAEQLMKKLEAEGTNKGAGKKGTCSVTEGIVPTVEDWDALHKYIKRTGQFHLLQRRVAEAPWRELFEKKGAVPGTKPFTKRKLNLTSA